MTTAIPTLRPAAAAFGAIADDFDTRFGDWLSVAAQRRVVREELERAFPARANVLEIGGGTGEDALWLASRGRRVLMTDASPEMVDVAARKLAGMSGATAEVVAAEDLEEWAEDRQHASAVGTGDAMFDGAFSNFAALNCVADLSLVGSGLARLVRPGGIILLVLFGPLPPGELVVETARGNLRAGFRRLQRGSVTARLGGRPFEIRYHRPNEVVRAFAPWFTPAGRRGVGVLVPPSAAEPWISRHPRLLHLLEAGDRIVSGPLAMLGDHILYRFLRHSRESGNPASFAHRRPRESGDPAAADAVPPRLPDSRFRGNDVR